MARCLHSVALLFFGCRIALPILRRDLAVGYGAATQPPFTVRSKVSPVRYRRGSAAPIGGRVALLVLLVVALIVGQTWVDWRETRRQRVMPEWVSGLALAAFVATPLTASASFASMWYQDSLGLNGNGVGAWFWFEAGFALCAMGIVIAATRKKRLRTLIILSSLLTVALWFSLSFFS